MHLTLDQQIHRFTSDFEVFAPSLLKIKDKSGKIVPFKFNRAQLYAHKRIEEQKRKTGMVRAVLLKGRQQGLSTYSAGRGFWLTSTTPGFGTFILSHEQKATDNLFGMVQRYVEHYPKPMLPTLGAANAKELRFSGIDSGYKVATAGNRGAGRSSTAQFLHWSEVAYSPAAHEHMAGIMQTIPSVPGTEIIFESTANGVGDVFHHVWQKGEVGEGNWQSIFIPWFWQAEYRAVPRGKPNEEDAEYGDQYDLDEHQLQWRRDKIDEMGGDVRLFQREYPASPAEAFSVSDDASLILSENVLKARKRKDAKTTGSVVIGVDPARFGPDRTVIVVRQGRVAEVVASVKGQDTMATAGAVVKAIQEYHPTMVFIDEGGIGAGVVDRLHELGFEKTVIGVNFGSSAIESDNYANRRAEMWCKMRDWLNAGNVQIPDDDVMEADLCGLRYSYDSHGRYVLESKDAAKKRGIRSPDIGDALALTWAMPVFIGDASHVVQPLTVTVPGMGY
jgi:hypothetical protein